MKNSNNNTQSNRRRKYAAILAVILAFAMVLSIAVPIASVFMA